VKREVKSFTLGLELRAADGKRRFTGIATTRAPDRYDEIVLPRGAEFTLPLPLLAFHRASQPVGTVTKAVVADDAITIEAEFIPEEVDPEADRCYGLARAGALRGLSIGFVPIESEVDAEGRVVHKRCEILEVSLVTVPANPRAAILNVKEHSMETQDQPQGELRTIAPGPAVHTKKHKYSFARLVRAAIGDRDVDAGFELEIHTELARTRAGRPLQGLLVPLMIFKSQDAITSSPDTGKSLAGEDRREALYLEVDEFFRPPVAARLGITVTSTPEDKLIVPISKKVLTGGWVARDAAAPASQNAEFTSFSLQPTVYGLSFTMERSLMYASHPQAEAILIGEARRAVEQGLDDGILKGTGGSNQPTGFLAASGGANTAASISGAMSGSNAYDHSRKIRNEVESYLKDANPGLRWLLHPMHVAILAKTPAFSGATTPLVPSGSKVLAEREFVESYGLPTPAGGPPTTTKGLFGDFSECVACLFGNAAELVLNPFADSVFNKGAMLARILVDFNTVHRDPKRVLKFDTETL